MACLLITNPAWVFEQEQVDPAALAQQAREAMSAQRFENAIAIYQELVKALPEVPGLRMNLGIAHFNAEQYPESIRELEVAVQAEPNLTGAWVYLGASHLEIGNQDQAVTALGEFVRREPNDPKGRQMLGEALLAVERFEEAAKQFQTLSKLDPDDPKAWYGLVRSYESLGGRVFDQLNKIAPESAYWFSLMGGTLLAQQLYPNAFFYYRQALAKDPGLRGVHSAIGQIYQKTGHPEWAAEEREQEEQLGLPDCDSKVVECDFLKGRFREALAAIRKAHTPEAYYWQVLACYQLADQAFLKLKVLPPSLALHELMAEIHQQQGRDFESLAEWKKALELSPGDPAARKGLAQALVRTHDYQAARPVVESLLKEEPESADLNLMAGEILLSLRQPGEAIPFLKKALKRNPDRAGAHASLGSAYLSTGEAATAIPHLKSALEADQEASLYYKLGRAYQRTGQPELAGQMLRKYQEVQKAQRAQKERFEKEIQITPP